jgi:hypothetical protein
MSGSIDVEFENSGNQQINQINMGGVDRGKQSPVMVIRIKNLGKALKGVYIRSVEGLLQAGTAFETYFSCFLSLDNLFFDRGVSFNLAENEVREIYMKWAPVDSSNANIEVEWDLLLGAYNENVEIFCN